MKLKALISQAVQIDARALAILRIGLGLLVIADVLIRLPDLEAHYSDWGVLPRDVLSLKDRLNYSWIFSIYFISGTKAFVLAMLGLQALCGAALALGVFTGVAAFLCWFFVASLQARNPFVLNAGDILLCVSLFWAMFLPLGARNSIDAARGRCTAVPSNVCSLAAAALVLQLCCVYWVSSAFKLSPEWTTEGVALEYALRYRLLATEFGLKLSRYPAPLRILTWVTLGLEIFGPLLLFVHSVRMRTALVVSFVVFHLSTAPCFLLGLFPPLMILLWVALLPAAVWDRIMPRSDFQFPTAGLAAPSLLKKSILALAIALMVLTNLAQFIPSAAAVQRITPIMLLQHVFQLRQTWNMFAPAPTRDGWFVVLGHQSGSAAVNLLPAGGPADWTEPPVVSATFGNYHWQKYYHHIGRAKFIGHRQHLANYLCRSWNTAYPQNPILSITLGAALVLPNSPPEPKLLFEGLCTRDTAVNTSQRHDSLGR